MTFHGTTTFLIGQKTLAVIDPGPNDPDHLDALLATETSDSKITHILITHPHLDHSELAPELSKQTGAPIYAFGPPDAGRSPIMHQLSQSAAISGGEGVDAGFTPDHCLSDSENVGTDEWQIKAIHLPGHMACHLGFQWQDFLFCGDLVMDWSSSLISPPDGDLDQFLTSLERLKTYAEHRLLPTHGPEIASPSTRIREITDHLLSRNAQIRDALSDTPLNLMEITTKVYKELRPEVLPYASRNTLAHLIKLHESHHATATPYLSETCTWSLR